MYFLAANPEVQDWMSEEIRAVFGDRPQHEWTASADFPRLKRCLAVLFETLRLYLPVVCIISTCCHSFPNLYLFQESCLDQRLANEYYS